jgi:hypothetical protein
MFLVHLLYCSGVLLQPSSTETLVLGIFAPGGQEPKNSRTSGSANQHRFIKSVGEPRTRNTPAQADWILSRGGRTIRDLSANEACAGLDPRQVAERLVAAGYLQAEMTKGRISKVAKKGTVEEDRLRLVCISADILTTKDVEDERDGTLKRFIMSRTIERYFYISPNLYDVLITTAAP